MYMNQQMNEHMNFIKNNGVREISNFGKTLHNYGFKTSDQEDFINYCSERLHKYLLKKREMRKPNASVKNILLNVLALQNPDELNSLLKIYVNDKFPEMLHKDALFEDFNLKTNQLLENRPVDDIDEFF